MTVTEAEDKAKALRPDGKGLYAISLKRWVASFGDQGQMIFAELHERNYGQVYVNFISRICFDNTDLEVRLFSLQIVPAAPRVPTP